MTLFSWRSLGIHSDRDARGMIVYVEVRRYPAITKMIGDQSHVSSSNDSTPTRELHSAIRLPTSTDERGKCKRDAVRAEDVTGTARRGSRGSASRPPPAAAVGWQFWPCLVALFLASRRHLTRTPSFARLQTATMAS